MSHIPVRTCVACRRARPRTELVRVVRTPDDGVTVEETATTPGRGAYVCRDPDCITTATRDDGHKLRRALRGAEVAPAVAELEDLHEHLKTTTRAS